jgi:hypothetical protein
MTNDELTSWTLHGRTIGARFIIILKDLVEHDYFPVFVMGNQDVEFEKKKWISESKTKIMTVIDL